MKVPLLTRPFHLYIINNMRNFGTIIIPIRRYTPGIASTNRVLAYAKGFAAENCRVKLIYLISHKDYSKVDFNIKNIECIYLWDNFISKRMPLVLMLIFSLIRLPFLIQNNDIIYLYKPLTQVLWFISKYKQIFNHRLFLEYTEVPTEEEFANQKALKKRLSLMKKCDGIFLISYALKKLYEELGIASTKMHIINMFVDNDRFKKVKKENTIPYICYCGSNAIIKDGVDMLIKSFAIFSKEHQEYNLVICHKNVTEHDMETLNKIAVECGVSERICFYDNVSPSEMPKILVNAKILALARPNTKQAQYGFPTKLGEYLASGNPVVVTKTGEIPRYLIHNKNAYLVEPDNIEAFALQLKNVANNYEKAKIVGNNGKRLACNEFSSRLQSAKALFIMTN